MARGGGTGQVLEFKFRPLQSGHQAPENDLSWPARKGQIQSEPLQGKGVGQGGSQGRRKASEGRDGAKVLGEWDTGAGQKTQPSAG